MGRWIFWVVFLSIAFWAGVFFWKKFDPLRQYPFLIPYTTKFYLERITHPNAKVANEAYWQVNNLYFTKWAAYEIILDYVEDQRPINFLIERKLRKFSNRPEFWGFVASSKPIFYKTDQVYCKTLGEAIMSLAHREKNWKTDCQGNWQSWWQANRGYYGR